MPSTLVPPLGLSGVEEFQCLNGIEEGTYGVVYRAKDKKTGGMQPRVVPTGKEVWGMDQVAQSASQHHRPWLCTGPCHLQCQSHWA